MIVAAALACACGPKPPPPAAPPAAATWKTQTAEHRVTLEHDTASGGREQRSLRGLIAVERPHRYRLRALGPAGITLFDLVWVDGEVRVLQSLRDVAPESALGRIVRGMARALAVAWQLVPAPARVGRDEITLEDGAVTVVLSRFVAVAGGSAPSRIVIDDRAQHWRATVEAHDIRLDEPLDPELWGSL